MSIFVLEGSEIKEMSVDQHRHKHKLFMKDILLFFLVQSCHQAFFTWRGVGDQGDVF